MSDTSCDRDRKAMEMYVARSANYKPHSNTRRAPRMYQNSENMNEAGPFAGHPSSLAQTVSQFANSRRSQFAAGRA